MTPPIPPLALWMRMPRPFRVAGPAVALALAAYAGLHKAPQPDARAASVRMAMTAPPVGEPPDLAEGFAWDWPGSLSASAMYYCRPAGDEAANSALVVWTDRLSRVLAVGPARESMRMPAYALVLAKVGAVQPGHEIHLAGEGHVVHAAGQANTLQAGGTSLACEPTWDD